ncbi:MAG: hypothetical protein ABIT10_13795 [Alteraurantiacibacter sp.]
MRADQDLALLAILTSRAEALVVASMLEAAGIHVHVGGEYHASVDPISVALGGHRLRVPAWQHADASAIVHEVGLPTQPASYKGGQQAVVRLLAVYVGLQFFLAIPAAIAGLFPWGGLLGIAFVSLGVPVDPRGQPDWHLTEPRTA